MISVKLFNENEGVVLEAVAFDTNDDFLKWKDMRSEIVSCLFVGRSVAVVTESPQKNSWVSVATMKMSLPNYELFVCGVRYVVALVDSISAEMLSDIASEEDFYRSLLCVFDIKGGTKEFIQDMILKRRNYPTKISEWLSCGCDFVVCEDDGATIALSGSRMQSIDLNEIVLSVGEKIACDLSISMG